MISIKDIVAACDKMKEEMGVTVSFVCGLCGTDYEEDVRNLIEFVDFINEAHEDKQKQDCREG